MRRVLIVYDVEGWAQHRYALNLQRYAPSGVEIELIECGPYSRRAKRDEAWLRSFAAVYVLPIWFVKRHPGIRRLVAQAASHALMYERERPNDFRTFGVTKNRNAKIARRHLSRADAVTARNEALTIAMRRLASPAIVACYPVGVDLATFSVAPQRPTDSPFVAGWCANPSAHNGQSFKGFEKVLRPLIMATRGLVEWRVLANDYSSALSAAEMATWYAGIDVLVSTASAEGTPNPPYEAAACGRAVLSTAVGGLVDWPEMKSLGCLVPTYRNRAEAERTVAVMRDRLLAMRRSRHHCQVIGQLLRQSVERRYDYKTLAPKILGFVLGD